MDMVWTWEATIGLGCTYNQQINTLKFHIQTTSKTTFQNALKSSNYKAYLDNNSY